MQTRPTQIHITMEEYKWMSLVKPVKFVPKII
jgi:hypothetical protein